MKIPPGVRQVYNDRLDAQNALRSRADDLFRSRCVERNWHYESRIKKLESFAVKIESGRVAKADELEDFFACSIVVRNASEIEDAIALTEDIINVTYRRPDRPEKTFNRASDFTFDDVRIYGKLKHESGVPDKGEFDIVFEVQIKTFLLHAWSLATHDLMYKTDVVSWSKERIAFQIRAMLEHAEVSIQEAERLADTSILAKEDKATQRLRRVMGLLTEQWPTDQMPHDLKTVSKNILAAGGALRLNVDDISNIFRAQKANNGGAMPLNLSPYGLFIQGVVAEHEEALREYLCGDDGRTRIVFHEELNLPAWLGEAKPQKYIRI